MTAFVIILTFSVIFSPSANGELAEGLSPSNPFDVHALSFRDNSTWTLGIVGGSNCTAYERTVWYVSVLDVSSVSLLVDGQTVTTATVDRFGTFDYTFVPGSHFVQVTVDGSLAFSSNVRVINTDVETDVMDRYDDSYLTVRMTDSQFDRELMEAGLKAILVFVLPLPLLALAVQKRLDSRSKRVV